MPLVNGIVELWFIRPVIYILQACKPLCLFQTLYDFILSRGESVYLSESNEWKSEIISNFFHVNVIVYT